MSPRRRWLVALAATTLLTGCPQQGEETEKDGPLVVYCGRGESLVGPVFQQFTKETGIEVEPRYGKTPELATKLATEGESCPADVIFAQDSGYLGALSKQELLAPLPEKLLEQVEERFRDPSGRWLGTSGRARVLVYSTKLKPEELPATLKDLADPKWKGKLGWAPGNSSLQAHLSYLRHAWGEDETRAWLEGMKKNEPKVYPKNSPQVAAAIAGEIQIGWVNHYYLFRKDEGVPAANYSFRTAKDPGNVLMVAGAGIRKGSKRVAQATKLLEFLVGKQAQAHFTQKTFEYSTVPGTKTHERVTPLEDLNLADVDQNHLADLGPTRALLKELGLQ